MNTLSIEKQLELIYPEEIKLTKEELDILSFETKMNGDPDAEFTAYIHYITRTYSDVLHKANSFADIVGRENTGDNILVWFNNLYLAQQAQMKQ